MEKLKATVQTARMTEEQLLAHGFTKADIDAGLHLPEVGGAVSNSSAIIADLTSAATATYSATAIAAALAAGGPIMDIGGCLDLVLAHAQEMRTLLCYVLEGKQISTSLTAPSGGVITTGADSATYNKLVGVYQLLQ